MDGIYARDDLFLEAADLAAGAEVRLFGAGEFGRRALALLRAERPDVGVAAFLDSRREGAVDGVPVLRPDAAPRGSRVLITTPSWHALAVRLLELGHENFSVLRACSETDHPLRIHLPRGAALGYVRVPKAASTSLLAALEAHGPVDAADTFRDRALPGGRLWFGFVRNPFDRAVSVYEMAFGGGNALGRTVCRLLGRGGLDFEGFVALLGREPWWVMDSHWRPQTCYVPRRLDFTGRTERMAEDAARLAELCGTQLAVGHLHRSARRQPGTRDYYTPRTRAVVERVYARDLERFGYEW